MGLNNWRTNLGGAISITGTSLIGAGLLPQLSQLNPTTAGMLSHGQLSALWWTAFAGFVLSCIGKGVTSFFAADAVVVKQVVQKVEAVAEVVDKINQVGPSPDTEMLSKPIIKP